MTGFDYAVVTVLALSLALGLARGVTAEILALAAWVAAFWAARSWGPVAATALGDTLREPMRLALGLGAVFVATLMLFALARFAATRFLRAIGLGAVDRLLGGAFGMARGLLLVLLGVLACGLTGLPAKPWWRQAVLASPLETAALAAKPWLPGALAQAIRYR